MTPFEHLVQSPLARAIGWTLLHSLWEGALAALALAAVLFAWRSPRVRYACAYLAMLGVLAGFVLTLSRLMPPAMGAAASLPRAIPRAPLPGGQAAPMPARFRMADVPAWLVPFWIAGVIVFHLRTASGWLAAQRLRRRGVCRAPDPWPRRLDRLRARLRLSAPVELLETGLAAVPVAVGFLRPVILFPAGMLAGMPAGQVEAILLHELAHIRRRDYLVNLLQTLVEGFLFYHPAIWWISRVIRTERENCCDDLAVAASGDASQYAAALAALEETRWAANRAVLASTGGSLVKRIRRLLYPPQGSALAPFVSAAVLILAAAGALAAWQAQAPAAGATAAQQAAVDPYTKWLQEDVVYIINDRERAAFLSLKTGAERKHFIEQFWDRRNPTPGSATNAFREEHYRRIAFANKRFAWSATPGWKTDRGRIYIMFGPPDEIESHPSGRPSGSASPVNYPFEEWRYLHIKDAGDNVIMEFDDTAGTGDFRMTLDPNQKGGKFVRRP